VLLINPIDATARFHDREIAEGMESDRADFSFIEK
jgi:hypothetical protein